MTGSPVLGIQRGAVILHQDGVLVAARLSGTSRPLRLEGTDLALLSAFGRPADADATLKGLMQDEEATRLLPGAPPLNALMKRLGQLHQARMLTPESHHWIPEAGEEVQRLADCHEQPDPDQDQALCLGLNFMLEPATQGFRVFLPEKRQYCQLDLPLALLLVAFRNGRTVPQVLDQVLPGSREERLRGVSWLLEQGLLDSAKPRTESVTAREESRARPGDVADAPRVRHQRWQDLSPDPARIPVYFFPHMENHYPLALGMLYSAIESHEGGRLTERFQLIPITYMEPRAFFEGPYRKFGPGVWLFSNYMWSVEINLRVSRLVKDDHPGNLTIHGGPSTPGYREACEDFFLSNPSVDVAVHGEGEVTICEVLDALERNETGVRFSEPAMQQVAGVSLRSRENDTTILHAPRRIRMKEPDRIPSPYTEGVFDVYDGRIDAAIIETNRGCPFACTFCDWGSATNGKVNKLELERVRQEIEWTGRHQVSVLWVADANFGMLPRDVDIASWIAETKQRYGYPREVVVNYTKNASRRLADIIKVLGDGGIISQGIISIQTSDEATLEVINRKNIKTEKYDELIQLFSEQGLPLSTDLMIGLPGITVEAFDRDLQRYMDADVAVKAYPTQLLPNSPMADPGYRQKYQIETDENDFLISCYSYTPDQLRAMKDIFEVYVAADGYGTLRYVLRYLQWDHGISAIDCLHTLYRQVRRDPDRFPTLTWVLLFFNTNKHMPGGWHRFYSEVSECLQEYYHVPMDSAFRTILTVSELSMPESGRHYPVSARLEHDVVAWFKAHNHSSQTVERPLADFAPGDIRFEDPEGLARWGVAGAQYDTHQYFWELFSPISRVRSVTGVQGGDVVAA